MSEFLCVYTPKSWLRVTLTKLRLRQRRVGYVEIDLVATDIRVLIDTQAVSGIDTLLTAMLELFAMPGDKGGEMAGIRPKREIRVKTFTSYYCFE